MTPAQEKKLNKEYYSLAAEYKKGNDRMVAVKKRMHEIRRTVNVTENIVDDRPDELALKEPI